MKQLIFYWGVAIVAFALISLALAFLASIWLLGFWPLLIGVGFFSVLIVFNVNKALNEIPQNEEWLTSLFKAKYRKHDAGLKLFLPFNLEKIDSTVFLEFQKMEINIKSDPATGSQGLVLKNVSGVGLTVFFDFRIKDSYKATYKVEDLFGYIKREVISIISDNFAMYELEHAILLKGKLTKEIIACNFNMTKYRRYTSIKISDLKNDPSSELSTLDRYYQVSQFNTALDDVGVEALDFDFSDFTLPESTLEQNKKKKEAEDAIEIAERELEKTKVNSKILIEKAEGEGDARIITATKEKKALELMGEGEAKKIVSILGALNVPDEQKTYLMAEMEKWKAISSSKSNDKVLLLEGNSEVARGAGFGAGSRATNPSQVGNQGRP